MANDITADILIIGTGIAGAIAGAKLAQTGLSVAFLESGKRIDRFDAVETFWNAKIKVPESAYPNDPTAPHPLTHKIGDYYQQMGPENFKPTYIKVVGGTTWHWLGRCCQTNANQSQFSSNLNLLGCAETAPLGESGGAVQFEI